MADCLFCKIGAKEIQSSIIYEDNNVLAFLDIQPLAPGHTVVIPKKHARNIVELDDILIGPLFSAVKKVTGALQKALSPDGFTIGINQGKVSGQAIDHLHIHIIPRFKGDGGKSLHAVVSNPPKESLTEIQDKISKILMGILVKKGENEPTASLIYRFNKRIQQSGVLREARKRRFRDRTQNKRKRHLSALYKKRKTKEIEKARKTGLI